MPSVEWVQSPDDDDLHDLWVDGRIAEYDVPREDREDALYRAGVEDD